MIEKVVNFIKTIVPKTMDRQRSNLNDDITRKELKETLLSFFKYNLNPVEYIVICDKTNNTPEDIDNNLLIVDVYVKDNDDKILLHFETHPTETTIDEVVFRNE